jgi:hypothetical protein
MKAYTTRGPQFKRRQLIFWLKLRDRKYRVEIKYIGE